jgi:hypothetical protein
MRPAFAVSAIVTVTSLFAVCPHACPFGPDPEPAKIAHLRNEIVELDASLITIMTEAENSISDDVESLHACIVADQMETVDSAAAYREAKSLVHDLDALRKHAIADLTLPSGYTPPAVVSQPLTGPMTDLNPVLKSTYLDIATAMRLLVTDIDAKALDLEKKLGVVANEENISIAHVFEAQIMMSQLSHLSEASTSIMAAANASIASMARNVK